MAVFDCRRTAPALGASIRGAEYSVGSGGNRPSLKSGVGIRGVRVLTPLLLIVAVMAATGCSSGDREAARATAGAEHPSERQSAPVEITQVVAPAGPLAAHETPEASLVRLSKMWDEAFARRDEALLRRVFHPSFTGIEAEIANMNSPGNKGTTTPVSEITIESEAPERVVLTAVFDYDEGPVRQRILLIGSASDRRIGGVQDLEG